MTTHGGPDVVHQSCRLS